MISSAGVATDPTKVQIITDWPQPTSVKDLQSFLGMAGYYRKFVRHFGLLSKPLTNLLKKGNNTSRLLVIKKLLMLLNKL